MMAFSVVVVKSIQFWGNNQNMSFVYGTNTLWESPLTIEAIHDLLKMYSCRYVDTTRSEYFHNSLTKPLVPHKKLASPTPKWMSNGTILNVCSLFPQCYCYILFNRKRLAVKVALVKMWC